MERAERRARKGDRDKERIRTAKGEGEDRRTTGNRKTKEERGMDMVADIEVWRGKEEGVGAKTASSMEDGRKMPWFGGSCWPHVTSTFHACPGNVLSS